MDAVFEEIARETVNFGPGDEEKWRQLYEPLYSDDLFEGVQVIRDERYGPAERNLLDVFVPAGEASGRPVMLFVHGGGFFSGDKRWSEKCYANIGCAFAKLGVVTVIGNHQLVPNVTYPGGAEDIQLTREWIYQNISASKYGCGSPDKVFLFGHSSGGAHIAANLYAAGDSSRPQRDPLFPPVAGVLYIDVPFWYDVRKPVRKKIVGQYYGDDAESVWGPKSAVGLFERLPANSPARDAKKLPTFLGSVEWEVPETADATVKFFNAYRAGSLPSHTLPLFHVLQNHNHLSNILSIGTTDTAQTDAIMLFINTCLGNQQKLSSTGNRLASASLTKSKL